MHNPLFHNAKERTIIMNKYISPKSEAGDALTLVNSLQDAVKVQVM